MSKSAQADLEGKGGLCVGASPGLGRRHPTGGSEVEVVLRGEDDLDSPVSGSEVGGEVNVPLVLAHPEGSFRDPMFFVFGAVEESVDLHPLSGVRACVAY